MCFKNALLRFHVSKQSLAAWGLSLCALFGAQVANASSLQGLQWNAAANSWMDLEFSPEGKVLSAKRSNFDLGGTGSTVTGSGTNLALQTKGNLVVGGKSIVVDVVAKPVARSVAKAVIGLAKSLPVLGTGVMVYEMINEIGYSVSKNVDQLVVLKPAAAGPTSWDPLLGTNAGAGGLPSCPASGGTWRTEGFCITAAGTYYGWVNESLRNQLTASGWSYYENQNPWFGVVAGAQNFTGSVTTALPVPATIQELEDAIASKSVWPTSDSMSRTISDAIKSGQSVELEPATVTGPSSVPGPTVTKTNSDGSTSTTTTTKNITYQGDQVTVTNVDVTNNYNPVSNTTTTTTETTENADDPALDQCKKYPKSIGCQDMDVPTDKVPTKTETITWAEENLGFGPGSCPSPYSFSVMQSLYPKTYTIDLAQFCNTMSTVVRPLVILFSLLAAFFIVAPVTTREF